MEIYEIFWKFKINISAKEKFIKCSVPRRRFFIKKKRNHLSILETLTKEHNRMTQSWFEDLKRGI